MAVIRFEGDEATLVDGESLLEVAEELGVPLGCQDGVCCTCKATVTSGLENLKELTEKEIEAELGKNERLICQCIVTSGTVELILE